jgi:hypothetical protein
MNTTKSAGPARLRLAILAIILALVGSLAASVASGPARAADARGLNWAGKVRPVIVLEHGA